MQRNNQTTYSIVKKIIFVLFKFCKMVLVGMYMIAKQKRLQPQSQVTIDAKDT